MSTLEAEVFMEKYRELWGMRDAIFWLFHDRCVMCEERAEEVNEIIPRARTKEALEDYHNQVTLCHTCHTLFHKDGVTNAKQEEMKLRREEFLKKTNREDFI